MRNISKLFFIISILNLTACAVQKETLHSDQIEKKIKKNNSQSNTAAINSAVVAVNVNPALCDELKNQFQTQLPNPILQLMQWKNLVINNPFFADPKNVPACKVDLLTTGADLERQGLTSQFISATLERLDWKNDPKFSAYAAASATSQKWVMTKNNQQVLIQTKFAPPVNACPQSQPISACKFPYKKWVYQLELTFV